MTACAFCSVAAGESGVCGAHARQLTQWGLTLCPFTGRVVQFPTFAELVAEPVRLYEHEAESVDPAVAA